MSKKQLFIDYMSALKHEKNAHLIECITKGFISLSESYDLEEDEDEEVLDEGLAGMAIQGAKSIAQNPAVRQLAKTGMQQVGKLWSNPAVRDAAKTAAVGATTAGIQKLGNVATNKINQGQGQSLQLSPDEIQMIQKYRQSLNK